MRTRDAHLTEPEFIDLLDGMLDADRRQHVDRCGACTAQAARVRASAQDAQLADDVPEPSPFFWTHFSARITDAVSREATGPAFPQLTRLSASWFAAAACAAVVVLAVLVLRSPVDDSPAGRPVVIEYGGGDGPATMTDEAIDLESDEAWALVRTLAEDMDDDQMKDQGIAAAAGAVERLTLQLTEAERIELARLLDEQLRLGGASESVS